MIASIVPSWATDRGHFNHTLLYNGYIRGVVAPGTLKRAAEDPSAEVERGDVQAYLSEGLPQWDLYGAMAQVLLDRFEEEMSAKNLVDRFAPPRGLPDAQRECMRELLDALWRVRVPVESLLANARAAKKAVDEVYSRMMKRLEDIDRADMRAILALQNDIETLRETCLDLNKSINAFPNGYELG